MMSNYPFLHFQKCLYILKMFLWNAQFDCNFINLVNFILIIVPNEKVAEGLGRTIEKSKDFF